MYKFLFILLTSFIFTQEPCKGTCFSEDEVLNITNNIKELQFFSKKNKLPDSFPKNSGLFLIGIRFKRGFFQP